MAQGHIVIPKTGKFFSIYGHMLLVPAVEHQDLVFLPPERSHSLIGPASDLPGMIAHAVHRRAKLWQFQAFQFLAQKGMDIGRPGKAPVIGTRLQIIVIADDQRHLGLPHPPQAGIHFF